MIRPADLDLSSPAAFLVVGGLALVDGVVPLVPARTALIGLGVIAGSGDRRAYPLLAVATGMAFVSDNISYWLGAHLWPRLAPHVLRGIRTRRAWDWVENQLRRKGALLVALARVLPGGPTPITLTAGSVRIPLRKFQAAAAISALLWSGYAFGVGIFGDTVSEQNPFLALLAGAGLAGALNFVLRAGTRRGRPPRDEQTGERVQPIYTWISHRHDGPDTATRFGGDNPSTKEASVNTTTPQKSGTRLTANEESR